MRVWPALLLVLAPVVGCLGDAGDADDQFHRDPGGLDIPPAPEPFLLLVCVGDELAELTGDHAADCNYRATHDSGPAAEVSVAVNPLNPLNLVGGSKDFTLGEDENCGMYNVWSGAYASFDGGRTWEHQLLPGHPGDDRVTALSAYTCGSDPVIAFGPDGTVYYSGIYVTVDTSAEPPPLPQLGPLLGYPFDNAGIAVTRSLDGGRSWEDPVVHGHKEDGNLFDKQWIAVDQRTGQVYVTYFDSADGLFHVQRSDDGALTFTEPVLMFEPAESPLPLSGPQFGQVVVAPDSSVHFTYWCTGDDGEVTGICHRVSTDEAQTWSEAHTVALYFPVFDLEVTHKYRIVPNPALAVDAADGTLYVAYPWSGEAGAEPPAGNLDIYVTSSSDGGSSWSAPVRVNDDIVGAQNEQWMPAIAVGPDGAVHVTWIDYRDDPRGQFAYIYYAWSADQGATWSQNVRVSDVAFDGEGGYHQSGAGTIGDYMGLAVNEQAVFPFWADTRDGRNDVFSAIIPARSGWPSAPQKRGLRAALGPGEAGRHVDEADGGAIALGDGVLRSGRGRTALPRSP